MAERPFGPLDQYQPFVDENGRVTPDWYSLLTTLGRRLFATYSTNFTTSASAPVVFADLGLPNQPDTSFQILVESSAGLPVSVISKTTTGFTLSSPTAIDATVKWMLVRS